MMKRLLLLAITAGLTPSVHAGECGSIEKIQWVLGDWIVNGQERVIRESWRRVSDKTIEGISETRSRESGELLRHETLRLVAMSGNVFYLAKVTENELPVPFAMTRCDDVLTVFENPLHDYPKRLTYRREAIAAGRGAERMIVRVDDGGEKGFTLDFTRETLPVRPDSN